MPLQYKTCLQCKESKQLHMFSKNASKKDHLNIYCKQCLKIKKAQYRSNPVYKEKEREYKKQYRLQTSEEHKSYMKEWHIKNSEEQREYRVKYRKDNIEYFISYNKANKHKILANTRKRQASKMQRTPKWIGKDELWLIQEDYKLAILRTKMFGFKWEVDHIIPLQGKLVSGLHVPENLMVIPRKDNRQKHNRFEI
jgi:HNH endonuclease